MKSTAAFAKAFARELRRSLSERWGLLRALRQVEGSIDLRASVRVTRCSTLQIGQGSRVGLGTILAAKPEGSRRSAIRIGCHTNVLEYNNLRAEGAEIEIGDHCLISQFVSLIASGHEFRDARRRIDEQGVPEKRGIRIGSDVWIGTMATLLPGVTLGEGAVIASGTVVSRDVAPYTIVAGTPARRIGERRARDQDRAGDDSHAREARSEIGG